ncbi:uncharacterized protein [Antedon mediterranea]|uniref:uncharacterized protein n=1 Tax=Antedon mediterranea TaxID=105859 RepID=UPI003AF52430
MSDTETGNKTEGNSEDQNEDVENEPVNDTSSPATIEPSPIQAGDQSTEDRVQEAETENDNLEEISNDSMLDETNEQGKKFKDDDDQEESGINMTAVYLNTDEKNGEAIEMTSNGVAGDDDTPDQ